MLEETIKLRIAERFAAPLPEFHKRRIVFWHDEDGEFAEQLNELDLPGASVVKLTDKNHFAVKKTSRVTDPDKSGKISEIATVLGMPKPYGRIKHLADLMQSIMTAYGVLL